MIAWGERPDGSDDVAVFVGVAQWDGAETGRSLDIRTATISGHAGTASDGSPIEGASVALVVQTGEGDSYFQGTSSLTRTDEAGRFELPRLPIQPYLVEAAIGGVSNRINATPGGPPIELRL